MISTPVLQHKGCTPFPKKKAMGCKQRQRKRCAMAISFNYRKRSACLPNTNFERKKKVMWALHLG